MNFPVVVILMAIIFVSTNVQVSGFKNLMGTPMQKCLNCLCHARSGCWSRFNCARYSISKDYWKTAGSYAIYPNQSPDQAYTSCMRDENCILNTVKSYTESFGEVDCNCDGVFDCKDRLAIHLFGKSCLNPKFGDTYASRFNECAWEVGVNAMLASEGSCNATLIDVRFGD